MGGVTQSSHAEIAKFRDEALQRKLCGGTTPHISPTRTSQPTAAL